MPTPLVAYSLGFCIELAPEPGTLVRLVTAIESVHGSIVGLVTSEHAASEPVPVDLVVHCTDGEHMAAVTAAVMGLEGVRVDSVTDRTFAVHDGGKLELRSKAAVASSDDLAMAYTPGVARVCRAIAEDPALAHELTIKRNTVAVVTDGTAVLGLGDIGPEAALPVMEGKAVLFKEFGGIDAFPVCLRVSSTDELVEAVERLAPNLRGHQPRGHRCAPVLRGRGAAAGQPRHPGLPRRPARHGDRHAPPCAAPRRWSAAASTTSGW